jgi:hypothetical protein
MVVTKDTINDTYEFVKFSYALGADKILLIPQHGTELAEYLNGTSGKEKSKMLDIIERTKNFLLAKEDSCIQVDLLLNLLSGPNGQIYDFGSKNDSNRKAG